MPSFKTHNFLPYSFTRTTPVTGAGKSLTASSAKNDVDKAPLAGEKDTAIPATGSAFNQPAPARTTELPPDLQSASATAIPPAPASLQLKAGTDPTSITPTVATAGSSHPPPAHQSKDLPLRTSTRVSACPLCIGCGKRGPASAANSASKDWTCDACLEELNSSASVSAAAPVGMESESAPAGKRKAKKRGREAEAGRSNHKGEKKQEKASPPISSISANSRTSIRRRDGERSDSKLEVESDDEDRIEAGGLAPSIQAALGISRPSPPLKAPPAPTSVDASRSDSSSPSLHPSNAPTPTPVLAAGAEVAGSTTNNIARVLPHTTALYQQQQQQALDPSDLFAVRTRYWQQQ